MKHGLDRGSVRWTENRLNCCAQRELGLFNWRGEGSERSTSTETWRGDWRKQARLCSVVPSDKARGSRHKLKYREFHLNIKTNTYSEGCQTLEQVVQRLWGLPASLDAWPNWTGCSPEQPAPADAALSSRGWTTQHHRSLPSPIIQILIWLLQIEYFYYFFFFLWMKICI